MEKGFLVNESQKIINHTVHCCVVNSILNTYIYNHFVSVVAKADKMWYNNI